GREQKALANRDFLGFLMQNPKVEREKREDDGREYQPHPERLGEYVHQQKIWHVVGPLFEHDVPTSRENRSLARGARSLRAHVVARLQFVKMGTTKKLKLVRHSRVCLECRQKLGERPGIRGMEIATAISVS